MDVTAALGQFDPQAELLVEKPDKTLQAVYGASVAFIDERVFAIEDAHVWILFIQRSDVGVVVPDVQAARADVGDEAAGVTDMQVPHGGGQHDDVPGR